MRYRALFVGLLAAPLVGCMESAPVRPVLTCTDCKGLAYYGPPPPDPRVEMAKVITGGLSTVVGAVINGDTIKAVVRHGSSGAGTNSSYVERSSDTTNNSAISDLTNTSHTSVTDVSNNTTVSDTTATTSTTITGETL